MLQGFETMGRVEQCLIIRLIISVLQIDRRCDLATELCRLLACVLSLMADYHAIKNPDN